MKRKNQQSLGDAIKYLISELGLEDKLLAVQAVETFEEMMQGPIMNYIEKVYVNKRILYVRMNSPELKNELQYGKSKIIEHINTEMGNNFIEDVKFL